MACYGISYLHNFFFNSIQNIAENSMILLPFLLILWKAERMRVVNNWQRKGGDNAHNTGTLACHSWSLQLFSSLFGFGSFMSAQQKPLN